VPAAVSRIAGTMAVIEVADIAVSDKDVVTPPNVQFTTGEVVEKFVPVNTRATAAVWPAIATVGLIFERAGPGLTVKGLLADETPLETTTTVAGPAVVKRLAGMVAVMDVAELAVTVSPVALPPLKDQFTIGVVAVGKSLPKRDRVTTAVWVAIAVPGLMLLSVGAGVIVKTRELLWLAEPGSKTLMLWAPGVVSNEAGIVAVIWLAVKVAPVKTVAEQPVPSQQSIAVPEVGIVLSPLVMTMGVSAWPATAVLGVTVLRLIATCPLANAAEKHRRDRIL
jgi:hypothetical protein